MFAALNIKFCYCNKTKIKTQILFFFQQFYLKIKKKIQKTSASIILPKFYKSLLQESNIIQSHHCILTLK